MNWFLYITTRDFVDDDGKQIKSGEAGVGECSISPGITDAFNGIMYVVPGQHIRDQIRLRKIKTHPSAAVIREIIEEYYNKKQIIEISKDDEDFFLD